MVPLMILGKSKTIFLLINFLTNFFKIYFNSQFARIASVEQRRKYKTEFDNDYAEYRKLHADVDKVSQRFSQLEERLRNENNKQRYRVS